MDTMENKCISRVFCIKSLKNTIIGLFIKKEEYTREEIADIINDFFDKMVISENKSINKNNE